MSNDTTTGAGARQQRMTRRFTRWLAVPALVIGGAVIADGAAAASRDIVPTETREVFDVLQLRCEGKDGEVASVGCRWTMPEGAAGVKVLRVVVGSGAGRQTVYRTADASISSFVDSPVRRGVRYLYVVRAFDAEGRLVAASRPAVAGVAVAPDPTVEVLRLDCTATGAETARCRWTAPASPARVLTLWRSVDGGVRERVASFANPFPTSYGDVVPTATSRAVYAVIATDGAGEIVARSRADGVAFPPVTVEVRPDEAQRVDPPTDVADVEPVRPAAPDTTTPAPARPSITPQPAETEPQPAPRPRPSPASTVPAERPTVVEPATPGTSTPVTTIPTDDVRPSDPVRPVDDEGQTVDRDGGSRPGSSGESDRSAPSGETDRAG